MYSREDKLRAVELFIKYDFIARHQGPQLGLQAPQLLGRAHGEQRAVRCKGRQVLKETAYEE